MSARTREMVLANVDRVREGIARACARAGRDVTEVTLVAAGKTVEPEALAWAFEGGVRHFGENYVQELGVKRPLLPDATWHFIGTLQSHTAHKVAELADVVETVVPGRALERLAARAVARGRAIPALLEVDLAERGTGVSPPDLVASAERVAATPGVHLAGLMTVPPPTATAEGARPYFRRLRAMLDQVRQPLPDLGQLSMGMSLDYEVAVEEGATMVRIGTALFGPRPSAG